MADPEQLMTQIEESAALVRARTALEPEIGLVLGSGLGFLGDMVERPVKVPYTELPGLPASTVPGHAGRLVLGHLGNRAVAVMQGRFHFYEGYGMAQVTAGVRLLGRLGVHGLIITNAAGGLRADLKPGDLMLIRDHINLMGTNPLIGPNRDGWGPRFPDMSDAYGRALRDQAKEIARGLNLPLLEGVYAAFTGPSYETPAEIRALSVLGADAVGMSTIPEVIAACQMGLGVVGISCISNLAAGISPQPLSHAEVTETADRVRPIFSRLVVELVRRLRFAPRRPAHQEG